MPRKRLLCLALLATGLFGCDHATKAVAKASLEGAPPFTVGGLGQWFDFEFVRNYDIGFSLLRQLHAPHSMAFIVVLDILAALGVIALVVRERRQRKPHYWPAVFAGAALVEGGAIGNIVDRALRGYVVDFIHVHGWPVFNVADIAVTVGIGLMLLGWLAGLRRPRSTA